MHISDDFYLNMSINNTLLGVERQFHISELKIYESIIDRIPILEGKIGVDSELIEKNPVVDGTPIELQLSYNKEKSYDILRFRITDFNVFEDSSTGVSALEFTAKCDAGNMFGFNPKVIRSSSSGLFSSVADDLGLKFNGSDTNDNQIWINKGVRTINFLDDVCLHAYSSNKSCYVWYVTRDGFLNLNDIVSTITSNSKWSFIPIAKNNEGSSPDSNIVLYDPSPDYTTSSGLSNNLQGYGKEYFYFDLVNNQNQTVKCKSVPLLTKQLNVNKNVSKTISLQNLGINCGNIHSNYYQAATQNSRIRSLFSTQVRLHIQFPKSIDLGDCVQYMGGRVEGKMEPAYSGKYIVSRIIHKITMTTVEQFVELQRTGVNTESTELY